MKFLVVLSVALACAAADISEVLKNPGAAPILKQAYDISPDGNFQYGYETANGINVQAQGTLENSETGPSEVISGGFSYIAPDGSQHQETYVANKDGFQPVSNDIPTPPPVPEPIVLALKWIAAHPPPVAKP